MRRSLRERGYFGSTSSNSALHGAKTKRRGGHHAQAEDGRVVEDQIHLTSCAWTRFGRFPTSMAAGKSRSLAQRREQRRQDKSFSSVGEQSTKFHLQNTESSRFAPEWEYLIELGFGTEGI